MSIRQILGLMAATLLLAVLLVSFALVYATEERKSAVAEISAEMQKVFLVEELEVNLLLYNRLENWHSLSGETKNLQERQRVRAELESLLKQAREVGNPRDVAIFEKITREIEELFAIDRATTNLSMEERFRLTAEPLESAFATLEELVARTVTESNQVTLRIADANRYIERLGYLIIVVLVAGMALLALFVNWGLYQPMVALERSIAAFKIGRETAAPERGPLELRQISEAFNDLSQRLSQQRDEGIRFISGIAHDLRNPLTALQGYVELLTSKPDMIPPERLQETFALLGRQVARMNAMIEDFLDSSRIEAGAFELRWETVDLRDVVAETVQLYAATSTKHELRFENPAEPVWVECDRARIEQVLNNLVSNAIKYSPKGGAVTLYCHRDGDFGVVRVADQGVGIAKEELQTIFTPFHRTAATRKNFPGVGLGLSVAKKLIEAHGGTIVAGSEMGRGSVFEIRLPAKGSDSR